VNNCLSVYHRRYAVLFLSRSASQDLAAPKLPFGRRMGYMPEISEVSRLVRSSASGSEAAWNELVRRYSPLVLAVTRSYQLSAVDAQDVSQTVWLRLVEHMASLREPEALPGWLVTTTARECYRQIRQGRRVLPMDPAADGSVRYCTAADPDAGLERAELHQALRDGLGELPARDQQLLRLRAADPPRPYHEISQLMGMPIGSIGPTLRRSLDRLRQTRAMRAYLAAGPAGGGEGGKQREFAKVD
jgi:RNA polymerase sigma factor (sigma-70 family)